MGEDARPRRRGRRRGHDHGGTAASGPRWQRVRHALAPAALLDAEQIEAVHDTSMRILEELGIELMSARACELLEAAGAEVDRDTLTVRMDRGLVAELVARAPDRFALTPRNPGRRVHLGGDDMIATLVAGPPAVHDCVSGRRSSNMTDYENFIRLAQHFDAIHMIGNQVAAPMELPAETRHLDCYRANLTLSDKSFHCTAIGRDRALDGIEMMALARGLDGAEAMAGDPGVTTIISVNSPRRFDAEMAEGLITMAEYGQGVAVTPFTLMGAMTPVTLAAALAQQNAEALFGIALAQAVRPGTPCLYGAFTSNVDMRSGAPAFGTPENTRANIASGQLARRYGLPYRATPSNASNAADAQAVWETEMSLWGCLLGGANMLYHAAGWLEGGLCASYEKLVIDVEMLQHLYAFCEPTPVDADSLGFDAIARVPTGGHFFGDQHTMERYQTAFYAPLLSDWRNHGAWEADGAKTATERATEVWQRALAEFEAPALAPDRAEALDTHVARRKAALGLNAPRRHTMVSVRIGAVGLAVQRPRLAHPVVARDAARKRTQRLRQPALIRRVQPGDLAELVNPRLVQHGFHLRPHPLDPLQVVDLGRRAVEQQMPGRVRGRGGSLLRRNRRVLGCRGGGGRPGDGCRSRGGGVGRCVGLRRASAVGPASPHAPDQIAGAEPDGHRHQHGADRLRRSVIHLRLLPCLSGRAPVPVPFPATASSETRCAGCVPAPRRSRCRRPAGSRRSPPHACARAAPRVRRAPT